MPKLRRITPLILLMSLFVCVALTDHAAAASLQARFKSAWNDFHALAKSSKRAKYRSNWMKVERQFSAIYKASPTGPYAPKSLFYVGRTYEELGRHSGLDSDFEKACEYFQRVVLRFPKHSWSDDALLRKADITLNRLNDKDQAYADLILLTHKYPKGDMYSKARDMLRKLDKAQAKSSPPPVTVASASTPAPAPRRSGKAGKSGSAHLDRIRFKSSDDYTRVVLDMDQETKFNWKMLPPSEKHKRPARLYVDLNSSRLGKQVPHEIQITDGILKNIRAGQFDRNTARVVLDFHHMQDYKVFHLYDPYRVVIDVYAPDRTSKLAQSLPSAPGSKTVASKARPKKYTPPPGSKKHVGDLLEQLGLTIDTVMLDAGHGAKDPGCVGNGLKEKDVNLRFVKILGQKLEKAGFKVLYTRTTDTFLPLEERTALANINRVDVFISAHCNYFQRRNVSGLEVYSLNLARTKDAIRVASRENAISAKRISDLDVILTDLMINSKVRESKDFASDIHKNMLKTVRRKYRLSDRGTREAPFYVLMGAKMPSILIELGYLSNPTEAKRLRSDSYLGLLADGVVDGLKNYQKDLQRYANL